MLVWLPVVLGSWPAGLGAEGCLCYVHQALNRPDGPDLTVPLRQAPSQPLGRLNSNQTVLPLKAKGLTATNTAETTEILKII